MGRSEVQQQVEIKHNGEILSNSEAAIHINEYFTTVATNLRESCKRESPRERVHEL